MTNSVVSFYLSESDVLHPNSPSGKQSKRRRATVPGFWNQKTKNCLQETKRFIKNTGFSKISDYNANNSYFEKSHRNWASFFFFSWRVAAPTRKACRDACYCGMFETEDNISSRHAEVGVQFVSDSQCESQTGERGFPVHRRPAAPRPAAAQQRYRLFSPNCVRKVSFFTVSFPINVNLNDATSVKCISSVIGSTCGQKPGEGLIFRFTHKHETWSITTILEFPS